MLITQLILLLGGLFILWGGAELLVKGSANLAIGMGVRPLIVGLTIVAMGTSSPELAVSLLAALRDTKDLSLANIIGSNIANIGLVISICAMIRPLTIARSMFRYEVPILLLGTLTFSVMSWDGLISKMDGLFLLLGFVAFLFFMIRASKKDRSQAKSNQDFVDIAHNPRAILKQFLYILLGLVGLVAGSFSIVHSAEYIAEYFHVSQFIIGVSIVAVGTSLPELAISAVGAARGRVDIAVGNAIGSNIFNTLFVIAFVSTITPIPVARSLFYVHYPFMIGFTLVSIPMLWSRFRLSRAEGIILFIIYLIFLGFIF
ncbi:calcium/sodium antiporter [candidate division KSB1 bacterium]|nr:calcium/sodium antiporter [candidate division KSB1 bacterium]RQW00974.1 MAG: calcium/sodium antiporter [candidate division KSB1 bacterium]